MNNKGQMTVVNLIMLVITLIILVGIFPVITSMISTGISGLTNDGLPSATNAMISALFALIPIVMVLVLHPFLEPLLLLIIIFRIHLGGESFSFFLFLFFLFGSAIFRS